MLLYRWNTYLYLSWCLFLCVVLFAILLRFFVIRFIFTIMCFLGFRSTVLDLTYVRQSPRNAIVVSVSVYLFSPSLSLSVVSQIVQLECALYRFLYRSQSTAPTMSLTSINNFFFFREKSVSCSSSLSVCLHTFTCALWFFFFDFWLYLNCKYQSQSSINHSPFPLLSTPAHKSIKRRLAPVTIFTTIRGRGELR